MIEPEHTEERQVSDEPTTMGCLNWLLAQTQRDGQTNRVVEDEDEVRRRVQA